MADHAAMYPMMNQIYKEFDHLSMEEKSQLLARTLEEEEDYPQNLYATVLKHIFKPMDYKYVSGESIVLKPEIIIALCEEVIKVLKNELKLKKNEILDKVFSK